MRRAAAAVLVTAALLGAARGNGGIPVESRPLRPIIAQLFADPEAFIDRSLAIYGLVIETLGDGSVFMLQDVSQRPLRIVGGAKVKSAVGDQITVFGILRRDADGLYVSAKLIIPTRVLGGGGCC